MTREEINDFLDVSSKKDTIDFIFNLESELLKTQKALDVARTMIKDSVSKDRYNNIVRKYNKISERRGVIK